MQIITFLSLVDWFVLLGLMLKRVDLVLFGCRTHFRILSGILLSVTSHVMNRTTSMRQIPGVPAAVGPGDIEVVTPPDLAAEPAVSAVKPSIDVGDQSSIAAEVREIAPDIPLPKLPASTVQSRAEAVSIRHRMSHFPKHP